MTDSEFRSIAYWLHLAMDLGRFAALAANTGQSISAEGYAVQAAHAAGRALTVAEVRYAARPPSAHEPLPNGTRLPLSESSEERNAAKPTQTLE